MHIQVMRWVLVGIIGAVTGLVALFIDVGVRYLFKLKYSMFEKGECTSQACTSYISVHVHVHVGMHLLEVEQPHNGSF